MPPKYKPGGKRMPPRKASSSLPKQGATLTEENTNESGVLSSSDEFHQRAQDEFEVELCWCIQQLENICNSGKFNEKRSIEYGKTVNLLKSSTVASIRKRQIMRNTFGDYRAKMTEDEKKHGRYVSKYKFSQAKGSGDKCVFLRKATLDSKAQNPNDAKSDRRNNQNENNGEKATFVMSKEPSDVPFRFNFSVPECE